MTRPGPRHANYDLPAVTALLHARPDLVAVLPLACVMAQVAVST